MRCACTAMNDDERLKRDEATVRRDFWRKLGGLRRANPVRRRFAHRLLLRVRPPARRPMCGWR